MTSVRGLDGTLDGGDRGGGAVHLLRCVSLYVKRGGGGSRKALKWAGEGP